MDIAESVSFQMIHIRDLSQSFFYFWDAAQGKDESEQLQLWQELYESRHAEVFQVYFSRPYWGRREDLPEALKRYKEDIDGIKKTAKEVTQLISQIAARAQTAFAISEDEIEMDVIAFVGAYYADGFGFPINGRMTIFLALERLAEYESDQMKALIAHELSHGFHMEIAKNSHPRLFAEIMKDPAQLLQLAPGLFMEGLAVAASKRIVPRLNERAFLFYGREQWEWCQENRARLVKLALKELENQGQDSYHKFLTTAKPQEELPYHRTGYYIGYLAIEQLLEQYGLRELAELRPKEYPHMVRTALREIDKQG
jgi:hypothetical protein